jgi:glycosyltransferase involved in cell wall biosynthesis
MSTRIKVLSISHSAVVGGYQDRCVEVARHPDIDLTLVVPRRWMQFNRWVQLEKESDPTYRIIARQPLTWGLRSLRLRNVCHLYRGLGRIFREVGPDIVEIWEEPFSAAAAQAVFLSRRLRPRPRVIFFTAQNIEKRYPPPFSLFEGYVYRRADYAFPVNEEARRVIERKGFSRPALVLPLGVNPRLFYRHDASALREKLGLFKFTVGFAGKFDRQKGVLELIAACAPLKGRINLLLIGKGEIKSEMVSALERTGLLPDARIIPTVPYPELPLYLSAMDALAMPSITLPGLKEQFGRILIEAMACAVPVIGSTSGEIARVIGRSGMICPEGDCGSLGAAIKLLLQEPAVRENLVQRAKIRVEKGYTWESIARRQVEVYRMLIEDQSPKIRNPQSEMSNSEPKIADLGS